MDKNQIVFLAQKILLNERFATQNAELGHMKAVRKYQDLADSFMEELKDYLWT